MKSHPRIACVYDWFDSWGGAERILHVVRDMYPHADWFTSWTHPAAAWAKPFHAQTSFLQRIPIIQRSRLASSLLYAPAFESFDFDAYDSVLSITSSYAKGILTKPHTKHISYVFTPTRFLWSSSSDYVPQNSHSVLTPVLSYARRWDVQAGQRPDHIMSISDAVATRIQNIYNRTSDVLYPPLDIDYWENMLRSAQHPMTSLPQSYYLLVSRFKPYKKIELAIDAFKDLDAHLVIVGDGSFMASTKLKLRAGRNVTFLKKLADTELAYLYGHAQALIMPQEEDFGYTALEAQVCGCAVIAYNKGGASETVIHGKTGFLFDEQTPQGLRNAIANFQKQAYTVERYLQRGARDELEKFDTKKFTQQLKTIIQAHTS